MANCQLCGREVPDGTTYCAECAAKSASAPPNFQPHFTSAPVPPYTPPPQPAMRMPLTKEDLPPAYKPLGAWKYFLYTLLFNIPVVGLICLIVLACGGGVNINLRNYARSYFCIYLVLAVAVAAIVLICLALGIQLSVLDAIWG